MTKEEKSAYNKEYNRINRIKKLENQKMWRDANKTQQLKYRQSNKNKRNKQELERKQKDPLYRLKHNIRSLIYVSFISNGYKKKSKTQNLLGCSMEQFKLHLEQQFEPWMNWDNRGLYNGELNYGWDIDHIIPLASATCEEDVLHLNHYTNLQPLCSKVNRDIKKHKIFNIKGEYN